jgi:hypothetical protein
MGKKRNAHRILVGKLERKTPLRRARRRWMVNIKVDLRYYGVVYAGLIWLRLRTIGGLL